MFRLTPRPSGQLQAAVIAVAALVGVSQAGTSTAKAVATQPEAEEPFTICDALKDWTKWKIEDSAINYIDLTGRYHGQYFWVDSDEGSDEGYETRRLRLGADVGFLEKGRAFYQFNVGTDWGINDADEFYDSVDVYGLEWEFSDAFTLLVGKERPKITQEGATSSQKILTFERSALTNFVLPEKSLGIGASGKIDGTNWSYNTGIYSGDHGDDYEHGGFGAGVGVLASVGYKVSDETKLRFDYFFQDGDSGNYEVNFKPFNHLFSLNSENKWGDFGLNTDLVYGVGDTIPDVYGVILTPYYDITDKLQFVTRYQYFGGDGADSTRLYSRYQRRVASDGGRGENQHSIYMGLNYYICEHALKLMAGVEYTNQDGSGDGGEFDGLQYLVGARVQW